MYKKTNIIIDKFKDDNYIEHVFGIGENKQSLVSSNVSTDKDIFEGYSDIFLNNEVTILEDEKTKIKEEKEIEDIKIPLSKEVVYNPPTSKIKEIENNSENTRIIENNFVSLSKLDKITNLKDKNKMIEFAKENLDFIPESIKISEQFEQLKKQYPNSETLNKQVDKICGL